MLSIRGWDDAHACPDGTHGALWIQNSWGTGWGASGYCWMPYSYLDSTLDSYTQVAAPLPPVYVPRTAVNYTPINPTRILDTRSGTGLSGKFNANSGRKFGVVGQAGVPTGTIAVTGNLTVTNQSAKGYLSLGPNLTNTPNTSTLNFPTGDNRANGVTVALNTDGTLALVYVAVAGSTTDALFDLTGYFTA